MQGENPRTKPLWQVTTITVIPYHEVTVIVVVHVIIGSITDKMKAIDSSLSVPQGPQAV